MTFFENHYFMLFERPIDEKKNGAYFSCAPINKVAKMVFVKFLRNTQKSVSYFFQGVSNVKIFKNAIFGNSF